MSHMLQLLKGSLIIADLRKQIAAKDAEIAYLQRQLGKARLLADLRQDLAAFDISADSDVSMFHRRQV